MRKTLHILIIAAGALVATAARADSEADKYGWKQFSPTATMSVTFDKPPTLSNLQVSPDTRGTECTGSVVGQGDVMLSATVGTSGSHGMRSGPPVASTLSS